MFTRVTPFQQKRSGPARAGGRCSAPTLPEKRRTGETDCRAGISVTGNLPVAETLGRNSLSCPQFTLGGRTAAIALRQITSSKDKGDEERFSFSVAIRLG